MNTLTVIGFGRFGELFAGLASPEFNIQVVEADADTQARAKELGYAAISLEQVGGSDIVVLSVPISALESTVKEMAPYVSVGQIVMDVCSVKVHPAQVLRENLSQCQTIATHPMFGPDSAARGLKDLKVAFSPITADGQAQDTLRRFWQKRGVKVIDTTPEAHDEDAAYSQAMPYILAHALNAMGLPQLTFTTRSSTALYDIAHYSARDSEQLYRDMIAFNPFVGEMLEKFGLNVNEAIRFAASIAGTKVTQD